MTDKIQYELFEKTDQEIFDEWVHTDFGDAVMNQFIRDAVGLKRQGFKTYSPWALIGHIRYHHDFKHGADKGEKYKISNNLIAYISRHAMEKCKELECFFKTKPLGNKNKNRHAVVVPIKEKERVA